MAREGERERNVPSRSFLRTDACLTRASSMVKRDEEMKRRKSSRETKDVLMENRREMRRNERGIGVERERGSEGRGKTLYNVNVMRASPPAQPVSFVHPSASARLKQSPSDAPARDASTRRNYFFIYFIS